MSDTRTAHPDYASDVDEMILDYLIWDTTSSFMKLFRARQETCSSGLDAEREEYELKLNMLDSFIEIYKQRHGGLNFHSDITENLDLKIRLLQFVIRFAGPVLPVPLKGPDDDDDELLDLSMKSTKIEFLPLWAEFLYLSAVVVDSLSQNPNEAWMQLAGEFLLQTTAAAAANASDGSGPKEIFRRGVWRWDALFSTGTRTVVGGHQRPPITTSPTPAIDIDHPDPINATSHLPTHLPASDLSLINQMLLDHDAHSPKPQELPRWNPLLLATEDAFTTYLRRPASSSHPVFDAEAFATVYPLPTFVAKVLSYCESVMGFAGTPVLVELERGRLESLGLGRGETEELLERCGWR